MSVLQIAVHTLERGRQAWACVALAASTLQRPLLPLADHSGAIV